MIEDSSNGHIPTEGDDDADDFETPEMIAHALGRVYHGLVAENVPPEHAAAITRAVGPLVSFEVIKAESDGNVDDERSDFYMTDRRTYVNTEAHRESQD